jgi:hypothetical protein
LGTVIVFIGNSGTVIFFQAGSGSDPLLPTIYETCIASDAVFCYCFFFICLFLLIYGLLIRTYPSLAWSFFGIPGRRISWLHLDMTRFLGYPSFP